MQVLMGSRGTARGVGVCLLPAVGEKSSKSIKEEQSAIGKLLGCSVDSELKKRGVTREAGEIYTLPFTGSSKLLGLVVGFYEVPSTKKTHSCSGSHAYNDSHRKLLRSMACSVNTAVKEWSGDALFLFSSLISANKTPQEDAELFWEALLLSDYEFLTYRSGKARQRSSTLKKIVFDKEHSVQISSIKRITHIVEGVFLARDLVNTPAGDLAPRHLVSQARKLGTKSSIQTKVLGRTQLAQKKMNGILAVGKASAEPPAFITFRYRPRKKPSKSAPVVGIVGKGVTFDSGGLSIKTGAGMETMKCDMSGAAAVFGALHAIAGLHLPLEVRGYIPTAENMINGNALRPGDVIKMMSGKTVEVLNTDAEGRLILADALHYASHDGCDIVIDLATLTGACVVALGERFAALYANDESLKWELLQAAGLQGEGYWPMPLVDEYEEQLKSTIADLKNVGTRWGGSITAALFLQHFVGDVSWAHMDIAGPAFASAASGVTPKGGTGFGVRTLVHYLQSVAEK